MQRRFDFEVSINPCLWATRVSEKKPQLNTFSEKKRISEFIAAGALTIFFT